mmetsp:Transcript_29818/g.49441  ORF Transcript_29818/g.49441 Transcript_29818/m.49441 type:complete len:221 (-) Transcript_29818:13-675(-)
MQSKRVQAQRLGKDLCGLSHHRAPCCCTRDVGIYYYITHTPRAPAHSSTSFLLLFVIIVVVVILILLLLLLLLLFLGRGEHHRRASHVLAETGIPEGHARERAVAAWQHPATAWVRCVNAWSHGLRKHSTIAGARAGALHHVAEDTGAVLNGTTATEQAARGDQRRDTTRDGRSCGAAGRLRDAAGGPDRVTSGSHAVPDCAGARIEFGPLSASIHRGCR